MDRGGQQQRRLGFSQLGAGCLLHLLAQSQHAEHVSGSDTEQALCTCVHGLRCSQQSRHMGAVTWRPPGQKKLHAQSWAAQWWTGGQWRRHLCFLRRAACWLPAGIHITYKGPCLHLRLSGPSNVLMKRDCMHMPASQG